MTQITPKVEDTRATLVTNIPPAPEGAIARVITNSQYEPFTPILDRLLIRRLEDAPQGKLGLPDKFRQQTNKGEVLGVGELVKSVLKTGDKVLFGEYNAERFVKDEEELWIVREADIRGVERLKELLVCSKCLKPTEIDQFDFFRFKCIPCINSEASQYTPWYIRLINYLRSIL